LDDIGYGYFAVLDVFFSIASGSRSISGHPLWISLEIGELQAIRKTRFILSLRKTLNSQIVVEFSQIEKLLLNPFFRHAFSHKSSFELDYEEAEADVGEAQFSPFLEGENWR